MKFDYDISDSVHNKDIQVSLPGHNGLSCWPWLLLIVSVISGLIGFAYFSGYINLTPEKQRQTHQTLKQELEQHSATISSQQNTLDDVRKHLDTLNRELVALKREKAIQETTNKELNKRLLDAESNLSHSRERLTLYNDILSPTSRTQGLNIRHFGIRHLPHAEISTYQYHLVLSRTRGEDKTLQGTYTIQLVGTQNGRVKRYSHKDLTEKNTVAPNTFSLKYYRSIEGRLQLPAEFTPEKVIVSIKPESKKSTQKNRTYVWKDLIKSLTQK